MNGLTNLIQNNSLTSIVQGAPKQVVSAISRASEASGVDFSYLLQQAKAESSFNPSAEARTSSATGLFQFIESTWESMIEKYGEKHGVSTEGLSREEILNLRKDPVLASNMAAELASDNERFLERNYAKGQKDIGATELYFAHFMGAGGAASFLGAKDANGSDPAAVLFPKAAAANKNVFYESGTGRAKSLDEVYAFFDAKFNIKGVDAPAPVASPESVVYANNNHNSVYNASKVSALSPLSPSSALPFYDLIASPLEIMLLSQLDSPWSTS